MPEEDEDKDVEDIIDQTKSQDRTTSEPSVQTVGDEPDLEKAAADAFAAIEDGDLAINITVRDENLAALFEALSETNQLEDIEQDANEAIGRSVDAEGNKASLARALLRVGFEEVAPQALNDAALGYEQHLQNKATEEASNF